MWLTRWLKVASVLLTLGASASGVVLLAQNGASGVEPRTDDTPKAARAAETAVFAVKPGKFEVTVDGTGTVEAARTSDAYSMVEGNITIISILPEGTNVKKGDLVCELDSAGLKDNLINQIITSRAAEAHYQDTKLARQRAEIAQVEFEQGTFKRDQNALKSEVAEAQSTIKNAEARVERTQRARQRMTEVLAPKGETRSAAEILAELDIADRLDAANQSLDRGRRSLELAAFNLEILEKYTRDKLINGLTVELKQRRGDELAGEARWELEVSKEKKIRKQIDACKIYALADGIIVYPNPPIRRVGRGQGQPGVPNLAQIEEGAIVRQRQKIFTIPDLSEFVINNKVAEAWVDQIKRGDHVRVKVDAFPNLTLTGEVTNIYPLPDATNPQGDVKFYTTLIKLENAPSALRPGLSASSEIVLHELDNVLTVPVGALLHFDGNYHVAVKKNDGGFDLREVALGVSNDKFIEIKQGIKAGESVAVDPIALLSDKEKREKLGQPPGRAPTNSPAPSPSSPK